MKLLLTLLFLCVFFLNTQSVVFADETPTPTSTPPPQYTNEFTTDNQPNAIVDIIKNFIKGFDSFVGGFIFYTPDPLADKIVLKDKSVIPGVTKYRNMFNEIAIPILAIIIAAIALTKIGSENAQELKSFALRLVITVVLFITVPSVLSYSIQFNNLLVDKITTTQEFTGFLNNYLDQANTKIQNGENSEQFGIPHFDFSLVGGVLKFLGELVVKLFLFILTFLFLLGGLLYIGFQFVIRFASLLFLGVLYPVIIPFMLSERTQNIVFTYFKSWFTFLIMQPAFVLGFAISTDIFTNILEAKGPSVGMLFFYTGFLFFLGGVNMLVARLFGDAWNVMSTQMPAHIGSRMITQPVQSSFRDFKRGAIGGNISNAAGQKVHNAVISFFQKDKTNESTTQGNRVNGQSDSSSKPSSESASIPQFSQDLNRKGLQVDMVNQKQGIVALSGDAYEHNDSKTGLTSLYPTRMEAVQDGVPEEKLDKVHLEKDQFIDLSTFDDQHPNPHNYNAMQEARKQKKELHYAHVDAYSSPDRIKHFLEMNQHRNEALRVKGVIGKRQGTQTSDHITRLYINNNNEKRQNI